MLVLTLTVVATSVLFSGLDAAVCYDGWVPFQESCYLFGREGMSFVTAEQYCQQHKSVLVHVNDAIENNFLKDQLRQRRSASYWWMGLTDEGTEGWWRWYGDNTVATFTNFHPGDLGNHNSEDCAIFASKYDYQWADVACSNHISHPVCEMLSVDPEVFG